MTSNQIAAPRFHIPLPLVAVMVAAAFALGALAGFGLPRIVDGASHTTGAAGVTVAGPIVNGAAESNMSDAAYQALRAPALKVAAHEPDMSDAAYKAFHGPTLRPDRSMSDAAYRALHRAPDRTMSDAAYDALHGQSTAP